MSPNAVEYRTRHPIKSCNPFPENSSCRQILHKLLYKCYSKLPSYSGCWFFFKGYSIKFWVACALSLLFVTECSRQSLKSNLTFWTEKVQNIYCGIIFSIGIMQIHECIGLRPVSWKPVCSPIYATDTFLVLTHMLPCSFSHRFPLIKM